MQHGQNKSIAAREQWEWQSLPEHGGELDDGLMGDQPRCACAVSHPEESAVDW